MIRARHMNGVSGSPSSAVTFEVQQEQSEDGYSSDLLFLYRNNVTSKDLLVDGKLPIVFHYLNLRVGKYAAVQDGVSTAKWEDVEGGTIETD